MTVLYALFGLPGNVDEAMDKAIRNGIDPVVFVKKRNEGSLVPGNRIYVYSVGVRVGRTSVTVYQWEEHFHDYVPEIDGYGRLKFADRESIGKATRLADELNSQFSCQLNQHNLSVKMTA